MAEPKNKIILLDDYLGTQRTEWTDKIAPGSYQIIVGTTFDTRNPNFRKLTIEIE